MYHEQSEGSPDLVKGGSLLLEDHETLFAWHIEGYMFPSFLDCRPSLLPPTNTTTTYLGVPLLVQRDLKATYLVQS